MPKKKLNPLRIIKSKRVLIVAGCLVGFFLLINNVVMPIYVNQGGTLVVPTLTGQRFEDASLVLDSLGLEPVKADTRPDPKAPVGTVITQNPKPDAIVKKGRRVYLTLSGGEVLVQVPRLRGLSTRDSKFTLERAGLQLGAMEYSTSDSYPQNTVISQSVPPGNKVSRGTAIGVTISRGKVSLDVVVPELTGRTLNEAEKLLLQRGLKVGNLSFQPSFDILPNTVVDQYPRAGESVAEGQPVDLFVVKSGKPQEEIQPPQN